MILIDHGHFQYNSVMHGLVLWAIVMITRGNLVRATVFMVLACMFKQMALYFALPFGVYALS
jgi:alpha-1,3-glucosyltransferase